MIIRLLPWLWNNGGISHDALSRHWNINLPQSTFHLSLELQIDARVYAFSRTTYIYAIKGVFPPLAFPFHSQILWPICSEHSSARRESGALKEPPNYSILKIRTFVNWALSLYALYSISLSLEQQTLLECKLNLSFNFKSVDQKCRIYHQKGRDYFLERNPIENV